MSETPTSTQTAELAIGTRPFNVQAKVQLTPTGLLGIAALVSAILLSTSVLVWVAKQPPRR